MTLEIKTAAELIALDMEGRQVARRAARETALMHRVLQTFVDRPGPVPVQDIAASFAAQPAEKVFEALATLDEDDLIRIRDGLVDLAYPFSVSPTPFVVDLGRGRGERYACCAIDALAMAPMLGQTLRIRSRCHHCAMPLTLSVDPSGLRRDMAGVMVWVGKRVEDERRACDWH
jgi:Alkylmercury lyase